MKIEEGKGVMKNTPWGPSQGQNKIGEGVTSYYTAGHGGIVAPLAGA